MTKAPLLLSLLAAGSFGLSGCGSSETAPAATSTRPAAVDTASVTVTIKDFTSTVPGPAAPGATVTVRNLDGEKHTITARGSGGFMATVVGGGSATFTAPAAAGSYPFICDFHSDMKATLVVS